MWKEKEVNLNLHQIKDILINNKEIQHNTTIVSVCDICGKETGYRKNDLLKSDFGGLTFTIQINVDPQKHTCNDCWNTYQTHFLYFIERMNEKINNIKN